MDEKMGCEDDFKVGDLVWAKMKGYCPWPAKIEQPPENSKKPKNKKYFVFFFGSENFAWISGKDLTLDGKYTPDTSGKKKTAAYQNAVDAFMNYTKSTKKETHVLPKVQKEKFHHNSKKKAVKILNSIGKKHEKKVPSPDSVSKPSEKSNEINGENDSFCSSNPHKQNLHDISSDTFKSLLPNWDNSCQAYNDKHKPLTRKQIKASQEKIGFIGLGRMGSRIVKNIIEFGHNVTVWNRSFNKCIEFRNLGAEVAENPADLILKCDITFCCVSDHEASKEIIFSPRGVLKGFDEAKKEGKSRRGFVEMTSTDSKKSREVHDAIMRKGGVYLEAAICGTSDDAEKGTLLIIASGDRRVFAQCETCFHAIGQHAFFLTGLYGYAARMSLFLNMISGTACAAAAEAMVLAEKSKIDLKQFTELLGVTSLNPQTLLEHYKNIHDYDLRKIAHRYPIQKSLGFALSMADKISQPTPVIAASNELFKLAKFLGPEEDVDEHPDVGEHGT